MFFELIEDRTERTKAEQLYYKYRKLMYKEAYAIINDITLAEDCVSEAFVRIIKILHRVDEIDSARTRNFLCITCKNVAKDMLHKISREIVIESTEKDEMAPQSVQNPLNIAISHEGVEQIAQIISELDPKYKDVIILRAQYEMRIDEIADLLGIKPETAKKRLYRARKMILEELNKR